MKNKAKIQSSRRSVIRLTGTVAAGLTIAGCVGDDDQPDSDSEDNDDSTDSSDDDLPNSGDDSSTDDGETDDDASSDDDSGSSDQPVELPLDVVTPDAWRTIGVTAERTSAVASSGGGSGDELYQVVLDEVISATPAVATGHIYVPTVSENDLGFVHAYDVNTGEREWSFQTGEIVSSPLVADGGLVYAGTENANLFALDAAEGESEWDIAGGGDYHFMTLDGESGALYIASGWSVNALDAATGDVQWSVEPWQEGTDDALGSDIMTNPALHEGRLYVGSNGSDVFALEADSGSLEWSTNLDTFGGISHALTVAGGRVFVGAAGGGEDWVFGLDQATGEGDWSNQLPGTLTAPLPIHEGNLVAAGDAAVTALDQETGDVEWDVQSPLDGDDNPAPVHGIATAGSSVIIGTDGGACRALDAATGDEQWTFDGDAQLRYLTVVDDVVFTAGGTPPHLEGMGRLYALDAGYV